MARSIHTKKDIKRDMTYIRSCLAQAADSMDRSNWLEAKTIFMEISAVASHLEALAMENDVEIEGAQFLEGWQVNEILQARETSK